MAEYIEREKAIFPLYRWRNIIKNTYGEHDEYVECLNEARDKINGVPAADVVPVRHGRWSRIDYEPIGHDYICSVCGWKNDMASHYCPNCGAKMDGEA